MTRLWSWCSVTVVAVICVGAGCSRPPGRADEVDSSRSTTGLSARIAVDTAQAEPNDGQWVMPARNFASTRYSGLSQITTENVARRQLAWSFSTGVTPGVTTKGGMLNGFALL